VTDVITDFTVGTVDNAGAFTAADTLSLGVAGAALEVDTFTFTSLTAASTVIIEGITVTAPTGGLTAASLAGIFANIAASAASTDVLSGTETNDSTSTVASNVLTVTADANGVQTDLAVTGTGAAGATVSVTTQGDSTHAEVTAVTFGALAAGQTYILNGLTVTAPAGGLTGTEVAGIFKDETDIVSGTLSADYSTGALSTASVKFTAVATGTKTLLADTGDGSAATAVVTTVGTGSGSVNYAENLTPAATVDDLLVAADTALNGTVDFYFGVVGTTGYLVQDDDGTGHTNLIKLSGVLDMAAADIVA
jgi:hypothetical protein